LISTRGNGLSEKWNLKEVMHSQPVKQINSLYYNKSFAIARTRAKVGKEQYSLVDAGNFLVLYPSQYRTVDQKT